MTMIVPYRAKQKSILTGGATAIGLFQSREAIYATKQEDCQSQKSLSAKVRKGLMVHLLKSRLTNPPIF
jgi:hypothetical protein